MPTSTSSAIAYVSTLTWPANDSTLTIKVTTLPGGAAVGTTYPLISYSSFSGTFNGTRKPSPCRAVTPDI